ncbi:hypothetical protein D3C78_1563200 [compost metagenome]|jgi:hypothetical protein
MRKTLFCRLKDLASAGYSGLSQRGEIYQGEAEVYDVSYVSGRKLESLPDRSTTG